MDERRTITRNGLICALIFSACFLAAWPVAEMGFIDDWSYIKSAQVFAQTGHIVYNGWATAMFGWQIPWGGLFIRLLGFSFTTARLSTFPIAIFSLLIFYAIQLRFGISARNAMIGALTLGLSPLFMPLAASFMSDVPGLFVILLCLYCCQRAIAASTDRAAVLWLCFAAASNVAGGTVRQIAWLGAIVMVPSTGWFLRKRRGMLLATSLCWAASVFSVFYFVHWFAMQPYSVPTGSFVALPHKFGPVIALTMFRMLGEVLCLFLLVYPVLIAWLPQLRKVRGRARILGACVLAGWALIQWLMVWTAPWIPALLVNEFSAPRLFPDAWDFKRIVFPTSTLLLLSLLVVAAAAAFVSLICVRLQASRGSWTTAFQQEIFWVLAPFVLSYLTLLLPLASNGHLRDRYTLGLMPFAIIVLTWLYQWWIGDHLPAISIATVTIFALLAIAGLHDSFAWQRARLAAIGRLRAEDIPRTEIAGGFDYDAWTQISDAGYLNDPRIKVPPDAYHPAPDTLRLADGCKVAIDPRTPVVHPTYFVAFKPSPCLVPSKFGPVYFHAWLPPFRRAIYVKQLPALKR